MSKAEMLDEIPDLTQDERDEIRRRLDEIDDSLSTEDWKLVDARIDAHRRDPASVIPIEDVKAQRADQSLVSNSINR